jgi:hypothetical protein
MDMNTEQKEAAIASTVGAGRARQLLTRIFQNYIGNLAIRLWDGETLKLGPGTPEATLVFHHPHQLRDLILFRERGRRHLRHPQVKGSSPVVGNVCPREGRSRGQCTFSEGRLGQKCANVHNP